MGTDLYRVNFNLEPESTSGLISEIRSLGGQAPRKKSAPEPIEEEGTFLLSSATKKNGKKKKKASDDIPELMFGGSIAKVDELDEEESPSLSLGLLDVEEILYRDEEDEDLSDGIISEQKKNYDKNRKEENPYRKEFAESEALLYELLEETKKFSKELDKEYKSMNSRVRGATKMKSELINSIISARTAQLSIIKEISSTKKTVQDLNIKANSKTKDTESSRSNESIAASYLQQIVGGHGRADFIRSLGGGFAASPQENQLTALAEELTAGEDYDPAYSDQISNEIEDRLEEMGNPNRSTEGDLQIMYERMGAKIMIQRYIDTNTWEFFAVDNANNRISHYPVPDANDLRVKFSEDGSYATDNYGRTYRVVEAYAEDDSDMN